MPSLLTDSNGVPVPQFLNEAGNAYEQAKGANNAYNFNIKDPVAALGSVNTVPVSLREPAAGAAFPGDATNGIKVDVTRLGGAAPSIDGTYGLKVDVSRIQANVNIKDITDLAAIVSAGTGTTTTGSPNDTTVFPDISGNTAVGVQVYLSSTAVIVALIIEAKISSAYYPLLVVLPSDLTDKLTLAAVLLPKINGVLTAAWRIKAITVTATTPTIAASYQYIS